MTVAQEFIVLAGRRHLDVTVKVHHECGCSEPAWCARTGGRVPLDAEVLSVDQLAEVLRSFTGASGG